MQAAIIERFRHWQESAVQQADPAAWLTEVCSGYSGGSGPHTYSYEVSGGKVQAWEPIAHSAGWMGHDAPTLTLTVRQLVRLVLSADSEPESQQEQQQAEAAVAPRQLALW